MPEAPSPRSATDRQTLLGIYLNDHLAGATAGTQLAHRTAGAHAGTPIGDELNRLAGEIEDDRGALLAVMRRLGVPVRHYKAYAASVGELLGRLKPNGRLVERSPVSSLIELDGMAVGIAGKVAGWRTLRELAVADDRLDAGEFDALIERALRQADRVEAARAEIVATFAADRRDGR